MVPTISETPETLSWWRRILLSSLLSERAITLSTLVVAGGILLSKVLGFARTALIARAFGTSADMDAFRVVNNFSDQLDSVIAGTTIAAVFIPIFSSFMVKDKEEQREGWRFASAVLNDMFLLMTVVAVFGMIFAPQVIGFVVSGFDPARQQVATTLLRIVLIAAIVFGVSGTMTGILHAQNRFVLASLASPLNNVGVILGIFFFVPRLGIYGLAWGIVLGSLLHLGIQVPGLVRAGMQWFPSLRARKGSMPELLKLLGPRAVTTNLASVTRILMDNLASYLPVGSNSALGYAYTLWQFPETLIGTAIALAVFPRLAQRVAANDVAGFRRLYRIALITILALAVPSMIVAVFFAQPIVAFAFQRGEFDASSTAIVARVLQFYALAIVGESMLELTARVFYANRDAKTPMFVALAVLVLRVALMFSLRDVLGAAGLALAYAVGVTVEASILWLIAQRRFMKVEQPPLSS